SYIGVVVNIPANYILIHVAGLGLVGAGLASILSQCVSLFVALAYWRLAPSMAPYRQAAPVSLSRISAHLRESLPICVGYAGEGGAYAFIGIMVGWLGATALAAHQVVNAAAGIAFVVPLGLAGAASIQVGHAVGEARQDRLRPILRAGLGISVVWQAATAAIFILFGGMMAAALSDDADVVRLATLLFIVVGAFQIADGVQGTALGALRGISDNTLPTVITLLAYWPLALPAAYILGFTLDFGAVGLMCGYVLGLAVAAVALPWRYMRLTAPAAA
ncbi:MAG: MATE family efflux transporter, partial [Pseudomonadota bacterium]